MPLPEKDYFSLGELAVRWKCSESDLSDFVRTGRLAAAVISPAGENLGTFIELRERKRIADAYASGDAAGDGEGGMWLTRLVNER